MSYKFEDYTVKIFKDKQDGDVGACIEEIPEVSAFGKNPEEALSRLRNVFDDWQEAMLEEGWEIPAPLAAREFSGKFVLRIPRSLHKRLSERAKEEGVSLNQETVYCLTRGLNCA